MTRQVLRRIGTSIAVVAAAASIAPATAAHGTSHDSTPVHSMPVHHEREPVDAVGHNDTPATAERLGPRRHVRILGSLSITSPLRNSPPRKLGGLVLAHTATDVDFFALHLDAGDVVGAAVNGTVNGTVERLALHGPGGSVAVASRGSHSNLYPAASPLPRASGRPVLHHVASRPGRYTLAVASGTGAYEVTLEVFRPGPERDPRGTTQTLYLDLDGAQVDTTNFEPFGAIPGLRTLSPLVAFLPRWGLTPADEPALARAIVSTARVILRDAVTRSANSNAAIRVLSSVDTRDPYGAADVSRIVIGGTVAEAVFRFPTVGVAESIDPGNFDQEETALVLLDLLSADPDDPNAPLGGRVSLNFYMTDASDRIAFIGRVLGLTAAHEAGHLYGNFHTNGVNAVTSLMDGPALDLATTFGIGPDGVGGTADDVVVTAFGRDEYDPNEAFSGVQDTRTVTAFALGRGRGRARR